MSPEQRLWKQVKKELPSKSHTTRIENTVGVGIPDSHIAYNGSAFWLELKIAKANRIDLRPAQIAWNYEYSLAGGKNFFLVSRPSKGDVFLFGGGQSLDLHEKGLETSPMYHGSSLADCVSCALRLASE